MQKDLVFLLAFVLAFAPFAIIGCYSKGYVTRPSDETGDETGGNTGAKRAVKQA